MGPKPCPCSHASWGFWLCMGVKDSPPFRDPSFLVSVPFSQQRIMQKGWQRKGRWGKQGGSLKKGGGTGPVRKEPSQSPPPCSGAESWGPGEEGRGGRIGSPAPGGSGRAPPGLGSRCSAPGSLPPPSASPGRECLVPAAPSPGPEGRAGRAASPLFSSPPPPRPGASRSRRHRGRP